MHLGPAFLTALFWSLARAQTSTKCNPLDSSSCPSDTALSSSTYSVDFTQGASDQWEITYGNVTYGDNGAEFTINKQGDAPTIQTKWYIFFGRISVMMRSSPGTGIVSSAILESDDLDEIDWEFLGGDATRVESDYFGKGNTTGNREVDFAINGIQNAVHNYTLVWTSAAVTWYVDGAAMRTLNYADALGGANYPQTPMRVKLGIWAGGDPTNAEGTIEWAGGETDYSQGPFTMYVQAVEIENYNPAASYTYGDESGSFGSIKIEAGSSDTNSAADYSASGSAISSVNAKAKSEPASAATTAYGAADTTATTAMWWTASASAVKAAADNSSASSDKLFAVAIWTSFVLVGGSVLRLFF